MFRLGEDYLVRLPRREVAARLILHEQTVLPSLAQYLPFAVPAPLAHGMPEFGYPWHWSVLPWLEGEPVANTAIDASELAEFFSALHQVPLDLAPAPPNAVRGVPLAERAASVTIRLQRLKASVPNAVTDKHVDLWQRALNAPPSDSKVWLHGDPHPLNLLQSNGRLSAVIDWGDVTQGDPATDLAAFWMATNNPTRRTQALHKYFDAQQLTAQQREPLTLRAQGWAFLFAVMLLDVGLKDSPQHAQIGWQTLRELQATG